MQLELDGSPPAPCVHRVRERRTLLLLNGRIGTVEQCRCGLVRVVMRGLQGRSVSEWAPRTAHAALPPLPSLSSKP